jgi:mono/diheme cytochrome c family protein
VVVVGAQEREHAAVTIYRGTLEQLAAILFVGAAVFALFAAYRYWRRDPWRRPLVAGGVLAVLAAGSLAAGYTVAPNLPTAPLWTRFAANPVPADPDQVTAGRTTFQTKCAVCHGQRGRGDGPAALTMVPRPLDLTVHVPLHSDGEIFWFVSEGIGGTQMPAWKNDLTEMERWQVVRYLRELAAGRP